MSFLERFMAELKTHRYIIPPEPEEEFFAYLGRSYAYHQALEEPVWKVALRENLRWVVYAPLTLVVLYLFFNH